MPRLKRSEAETQNRLLAANIQAYKERFQMTDAMIANAVGCSTVTICIKRKKPEMFSLKEVALIAEAFDDSLGQLLMDSNCKRLALHEMEPIIRENIKKLMCFYNVSPGQLAIHAHVCKETLYERFKSPRRFKMKEIRLITNKFRVPLIAFLTEPINLSEKVGACV